MEAQLNDVANLSEASPARIDVYSISFGNEAPFFLVVTHPGMV